MAVAAGCAVLVVDVPHDDPRIPGDVGEDRLGDPSACLGVGGGVRAADAAGAVVPHAAVGLEESRFRMLTVEPGGGRGGGRCEVNLDACVLQQPDDLVEPGEVEAAGLGLEEGPGPDAQADHRDSGLLHEANVLAPDLGLPLLGVVVGPEVDHGAGDPILTCAISFRLVHVRLPEGNVGCDRSQS